jgi:cysteine desulfurase
VIDLDHNATTPLHPAARAAVLRWLDAPANSFAAHAAGRAAHAAVEDAREQVADMLGVAPDDVVFTSGATEANALALAPGESEPGGWVCAPIEHPSVTGWARPVLRVDGCGRISPADLTACDAHGVRGVAVQAANNETGVLQELGGLVEAARGRGWRVHIDAAQAPGRIPLDLLRLADSVTISAHKMGGPQGVGAWIRPGRGRDRHDRVLFRGGPQERGARPGTHPVASIAGFGAAAAAVPERRARSGELAARRDRLEAACVAMGGTIAGAGASRLPNTCCVGFAGVEAADLVIALDLAGIAASAGAACASGSPRPSATLQALGFRQGAVRFSLGHATTDAEIDTVLERLPALLARARLTT